MTFTIQKASTADLDTLNRIEQDCFTTEAFSKSQIASLLKAANSISLLTKVDGQTVGFIIGLVHDYEKIKIGHIVTIDVLAKCRRKGVGMELLKEIEKEFRNVGVRVCYLEVRADNVVAKQLYLKLGYSKVEVLENYYCRGGNGIRLEKTLLP
jgi:ribosomal-protein-alanine acetyltransferase